MIKVVNERVVSFSLDYQDIYWEIEPTSEDVQEYAFYVERSEAEAGPWDTIAGPLYDRYFLRDNSVPLMTNNRTLFYRIKVVHLPTQDYTFSAIVDRTGKPDLYSREMIRLENIMFSEFVGARAWLYPRRTFGQRCPACYDPILQKRTTENCRTCWGTTFSGGYHYPIQIWAQIDESEQTEQVTMQDHRQVYYFSLRTGPSPDIKPLDLVIDHLNRRFRVFTVGGTNRFGVTVRQEVKLVQIQKGSIEDSIPLNIPATLDLVPKRNFENAQFPEDSKVPDLSNMFSAYGYKNG